MIVRDVLENTTGLSWEPMVMWRACRETIEGENYGKTADAIDCLHWYSVDISLYDFFKGYENGRWHTNKWPEMLKLKDWPPATFLEKRLPRHGDEFISAFPFKEYTHPISGILNLVTRLPR